MQLILEQARLQANQILLRTPLSVKLSKKKAEDMDVGIGLYQFIDQNHVMQWSRMIVLLMPPSRVVRKAAKIR